MYGASRAHPVDLSPTDIAILRCLERDARMSLREIARTVGVSTPTVSARVGTLESLGVIQGYRAHLDPERLNEALLSLVIKVRPGAVDDVAARIAELSGARRVTVARGNRVLVDATFVDASAVDALLDAVSALPGVLDVAHHVGVRTLKDEPRAVVAEGLTARLTCFECKGPIKGDPVKATRDGRDLYFCCHTCEGQFLARYDRVKARASRPQGRAAAHPR